MPNLYVLVGIPGAGKSTWIFDQSWAKNCAIISTDDYVSAYARSVGKTYSEVFDSFMPEALKLMINDVIQAREDHRDIIWDQKSTTVASRVKKLRMLPKYHAIAVVFHTPEITELQRRLANRPGKIIPDDVIKKLIEGFVVPTLEEGFKEIWHV